MREIVIRVLSFGLLFVCVATGVVHAEGEKGSSWTLSGGVGVFSPFDGKTAPTFMGRSMWGAPSSNTRLGVEFEYSKFKTTLFKVKNVETKSYAVRFLWQHFFRPEKISPYLGAGIGLSLNQIDDNKIERERPNVSVASEYGVGGGVLGLAGLEVPIGAHLAFFAEGRVRLAYQLTEESGEGLEAESLSGLSGLGGIRLRF